MKHFSASPAPSRARGANLHGPKILDYASTPRQQGGPSNAPRPVTEQQLRLILKARRNRAQFFDGDLFADPAWDMLLELYAAKLGQRRMSVSSLCVGAAVPATTALRWLQTLEKKGLVVRTADPYDGRRVFVSLSETAVEGMAAYFEQQSGGVIS